jgi:hypothetical protein
MKMKIIIICLLWMLVFIVSCKQEYYEIPRDEEGNVILTNVASCSTTGISSLDDEFSVNAILPNAKAGDEIKIVVLKLQTLADYPTEQLLPLAGTEKTITLSNDSKASVSYTREETNLNNVGDYVVVVFYGETDAVDQRVDMVNATTATDPMIYGINVDIARTAETAYFNIKVDPKTGDYNGNLIAKRKNGINKNWVDVTGSPFTGDQPFLVPISGDDFAVGKDTMYYSFTTQVGEYKDEITKKIIIVDPYFYSKDLASLTLNTTSDGVDLLNNNSIADTAAIAANYTSAIVSISSVSGSLRLHSGSAWREASENNTIGFVPSTLDMYKANNSKNAIAAFEEGVEEGDETTSADPLKGEGIYIFKVVNGTTTEKIYYGILHFVTASPNSVTFEYRIGNLYAHLPIIE